MTWERVIEHAVRDAWEGVAADAEAAGVMDPDDRWDLVHGAVMSDEGVKADPTVGPVVRDGFPYRHRLWDAISAVAVRTLSEY